MPGGNKWLAIAFVVAPMVITAITKKVKEIRKKR